MSFEKQDIYIEPLIKPELENENFGKSTRELFGKAVYLFSKILVLALLLAVIIRLIIFVFPSTVDYGKSLLEDVENEENQLERFFRREKKEIVREFEDFEKRFERVWSSGDERIGRYKNFKKSYYEVEKLNKKARSEGKNTTFGINELSDWSFDEEFRKMLLPLDFYRRRLSDVKDEQPFIQKINPIFEKALMDDDYPNFFDWRDKGVVTPVKAQGQCGSCWAFAATATVESAYAIASGELRNLSEQEFLDCNLSNNGCNGGNENKAFRFVHEFGLVRLDEYPYIAKRQNSCLVTPEEERVKINSAYYLNPDEKSMIDWLVNFGPVNVGIAVPPDMKPYKHGVYHPSDYDCKYKVVGLHALMITGYGTTDEGEKYWIVKNSWGATWGGEHGYVYFARGINACGIEDEPVGILA